MISEFFTTPLFRLTLLFTVALILVVTLRRMEPAWKIALIRGAVIGGLLLFLAPLSGLRWELTSWSAPAPAGQATTSETTAQAPLPTDNESADRESAVATSSARVVTRSALTSILILWVTVASILLLRLARTLQQERKRIRHGTDASADLFTQWKEACREIGVQPRRAVVLNENTSPHLSFDGTLVLPALFTGGNVSESAQRHVLRHEAAHLKAADQLWFPLLAILTSVLWFHPLAWWLRSRHLVACEEARDAEAARLGGAEAYRSSVAKVALGLIPTASPTPGLLRKNGRLVARLNRVEETIKQSPPLRAALVLVHTVLIAIAILIGTAAPALVAATSTDQLTGVWRAVEPDERFARQIEIYQWGGKVKLRIWHAFGTDTSLKDATIVPFHLSREELNAQLASEGSISVQTSSGFANSVYSISVRNGELQFVVERTYHDNSGRGTREHTSYFVPGKWEDFESTF